MDYLKTYKEIFENIPNYDTHPNIKERFDFVINEIISKNHKKILDVSSGRGVLIEILQFRFTDLNITSTDLENFHNLNVKFVELDLTNKNHFGRFTEKYDLLVCLDVLEHIELKYIDDILMFFTSLSNNFCFSIANHSDIRNGIDIHLIQENRMWWDDRLIKHFQIINAFNMYDDRLFCYILTNRTNEK